MILSFGDSFTEKIWTGETVKIHPDLKNKALKKLFLIDSAPQLDYLTHPPGNKLEKLKGTRKDTYSIRVNQQWRITFQWSKNQASEVKLEDYHD